MKFSGSKIILMMMKSFSLSCLFLGFCIYGFTFWRGLKFSDISYESNLFSNYSKDSELPHTIHQNKNYDSDLYTRISAATINKKYPILFSSMYKFPFYGKQDKEEIIYRHLKEYKKYKYLKNHDEQISQDMYEIIGQIIYSYHWKNSSSQRQEINYLLSTIE